jgi:tetratricopeptide (TPR) repeat protein
MSASLRRGLLPALLVLLALLPYLNSLSADFAFDDYGLVIENPGRPRSALAAFRHGEAGGLYRPLTALTFMANEAAGQGPFGYHLVNVVLHAATTLVAFALASLLLGGAPEARVAAALFAVHPVHTEAVTNVAGRAEVLAALLVLASLLVLAWSRGAARRHPIWPTLSAILFAAALLAKESAFVTVGLAALVSAWLERSTPRGVVRSVLPFVLLGGAYLLFRLAMFGVLTQPKTPPVIDNPLAWVPLWPRVATAIVVLWQYVSVLAVPLRLSSDDSLNQIPVVASALDLRLLLALGLFAALVSALVALRRRAPVLVFAGLFLAVSMAVTSNLALPIGAIKAERFLYLPSFGWCLGCAWLLERSVRSSGRRALLVAAVLVALAGRTWARNRDWQNNFSLFTADVAASPNSARANSNAAAVYAQAGELFMAVYHYQRALAIFPQYATAAQGLAQAYELRGMDDAALHWYARALKLDHRLPGANLRRGGLLLKKGEPARAEVAFRAALRTDPDDARLLVNLALARLAQRDPDRARALVARAESLLPSDPALRELVAGTKRVLATADAAR